MTPTNTKVSGPQVRANRLDHEDPEHMSILPPGTEVN